MNKFLLTFIGGNMPETPQAIQESEAAWGAWYGQLGQAIVDAGRNRSNADCFCIGLL